MAVQKIVNGVDLGQLKDVLRTMENEPHLAAFRFRAHGKWINGPLNRVTVKDFHGAGKEDTTREEPFVFDADEPPMLLGENRGANPVEYALTALSTCLTTSMVMHAAARGIRIEELETHLEGEIDLRGFLGLTDEVRKGYQKIRVTFEVKSDAPPEKLRELAQFSPVYDTIANAVPVEIEVKTRPAD